MDNGNINAKEKEAASARGEAKAMTALGVAGGAGWGVLEGTELLCAAIEVAPESSKAWKAVGFASGAVALGALGYAVIKHRHAHQLEQENEMAKRNASPSSFQR